MWSVRNTGWYIQKTLTTRRICPRSTQAFLNAATDDESFWEQDKILEETIEEKEYLLYYKYVTPSEREKDQKVRHILLYCPVHDTTALMDQITRVVLLTMSVIAAAPSPYSGWWPAVFPYRSSGSVKPPGGSVRKNSRE